MKSFVFVCLLYAGVCAFRIPHDLPDGDYRIHYSPDLDAKPLVRRASSSWTVPKSSWTVPEQQEHYEWAGTGEYSITVDENSDHASIDKVNVDIHHDAVRLPIPDLPGQVKVECIRDIHHPLHKDDHWASKQSLYNWCSLYPFSQSHIELSLRGSVAVYVCNRKWKLRQEDYCSEAQYEEAEALMNKTCGDAGSSSVYIKPWDKEYGRGWRGMPICPDNEGFTRGKIPQFRGHKLDREFLDSNSRENWDKPAQGDTMIDLDVEKKKMKMYGGRKGAIGGNIARV